ncbi:MAG: hypothetical protein ABIQ70_02840 [Dokdonella sp.]
MNRKFNIRSPHIQAQFAILVNPDCCMSCQSVAARPESLDVARLARRALAIYEEFRYKFSRNHRHPFDMRCVHRAGSTKGIPDEENRSSHRDRFDHCGGCNDQLACNAQAYSMASRSSEPERLARSLDGHAQTHFSNEWIAWLLRIARFEAAGCAAPGRVQRRR